MDKLYRIHPRDNVFVVRHPIAAGEGFVVEGRVIHAAAALQFGHKVAAKAIGKGERVVKFGIPIGSATKPIEPGDHVHLHNLASDYITTYTLYDSTPAT